jgi:essential nuclear protein 1
MTLLSLMTLIDSIDSNSKSTEVIMPKEKTVKKSTQLRHAPLGNEIDKPMGKLKAPKGDDEDDIEDGDLDAELELPKGLGAKIFNQAREQRMEMSEDLKSAGGNKQRKQKEDPDSDDFSEADSEEDGDEDYEGEGREDMVEFDGDYVSGARLSADEEAVVERFLQAGRAETRTLADIIMDKIREKEEDSLLAAETSSVAPAELLIPPKVMEVYNSVGKMLAHYKAGKLPKALKMLPHLKNWEDILWITRPDEWSPSATYACTRIFASNLNEKMAQRFFNLVLLEKCRDDIRRNNKLNYHYYMALKKALFKPAAFYKGLLLPLAQSRTCTLREATIIGSVLAKVSIPGNHSAAALLRLAEMPYSGSTSLFVRVIVNKKYALPRRVIDALVIHFCAFEKEAALLPVRNAPSYFLHQRELLSFIIFSTGNMASGAFGFCAALQIRV